MQIPELASALGGTDLMALLGLVAGLSVASERIVEVVKGPVKWLDEKKSDPRQERLRHAALHVLALAAGIVTAYVSQPAIRGLLPNMQQNMQPLAVVVLGFLASGGSGFWNSVSSRVQQGKNIRATVAATVAEQAAIVKKVSDRVSREPLTPELAELVKATVKVPEKPTVPIS